MNLELKLSGSSGNRNLQGNFSLSGSPEGQEGEPDFCLPPRPKTPDRYYADDWHVTALIATIPNPELTHLSLTFDRYVESIGWAVSDGNLADEKYSFDSYWFPWRPDQKQETDPEKQKAAEREREKRSDQPGILLFHRSFPGSPGQHPEKELLMVFLAGETPTSGINRVAFNRAWDYADKWADKGLPICHYSTSCVGILGPSFTGSLPSLRLLLEEKQLKKKVFVISGAVTGERPSAPDGNTWEVASGVPLCTTLETERNKWNVASQFLDNLSSWHFRDTGTDLAKHFALLAEDETAYGEAAGNEQGKKDNESGTPLTLRFPRGIARIRNSSEDLPGSVDPTRNAAYPELPLVLRDTGQDTIPSFSQEQGPVSQEAVLIELAAALRRERSIRYVGIVATDSLDALFLTRAVRALAPNIRIVLLNADLLFARASQSWGLSGVMAVTSYPLISRTQYYSGAVRPRRTQFAIDSAEAEYNACRRMLLAPPETKNERPCSASSQTPKGEGENQDYLLDYAAPFAKPTDIHKPSVWLTILGRNEWWPVAAVAGNPKSPLLEGPAPGAHDKEKFSVEPGPQPWFLFFWLTWTACLLHVGLVLGMNIRHVTYFRRFASRFESWWKYGVLRRLGWDYKRHLGGRRRGTLAVASLAVAFACGSMAASVRASGLDGWGGYSQLTAGSAVGAAALLEALWAAWGNRESRHRWIWFGAVALAAVAEIAGAFYSAVSDPISHAREFAGYRAVHIESGTSPVLPIILLLLAIYLFCWFRLSRLRMSEERDAQPPTGKEAEALPDVVIPGTAVQKIGPWQWAFIGAAMFGWGVFFNPLKSLATIEGLFYDVVLSILSSIVVFIFTLVFVRFLVTWRGLQKLLQDLERHPLRYAFSRLPKGFSWTIVWAGDPRPKLILPSRSLDVLRMIPDVELQEQAEAISRELTFLRRPSRSFAEVPNSVERLNQALNKAFGQISKNLRGVWREGVSDSIASREKKDEAPPEWTKHSQLIAEEEFLALRFVTFIAYALRIMRGFLEFITYGFILLVVALAVYPFEGRRHIEIAMVFIFAAASVGMVTVFAQMDRDPLLSRLSETKPNQLGLNFVYRLVSFGALPLLTLLASEVPDIGNFLLSWLQPALQSMK